MAIITKGYWIDIYSLYYSAKIFFAEYGWYLIALAIFYYKYKDKISKKLDEWYEKREERRYAAKYHKNPDLARERMEGMAMARKKMQEELDRKANEVEEKRKELEEKKNMEKKKLLRSLNEQEPTPSTSSSLKSGYLPLMGDNTGSRYRPQKKSCCKKGGGCG